MFFWNWPKAEQGLGILVSRAKNSPYGFRHHFSMSSLDFVLLTKQELILDDVDRLE